jgi:hypothetical protein
MTMMDTREGERASQQGLLRGVGEQGMEHQVGRRVDHFAEGGTAHGRTAPLNGDLN